MSKSPVAVFWEREKIGIPVWRFAASSGTVPLVYAPERVTFEEDGSFRLDSPFLDPKTSGSLEVWSRTYLSRLEHPLDLNWLQRIAVHLPHTESDLNQLCAATLCWGGCIEIIAPVELSNNQLDRIAEVWNVTSRRLRYLSTYNLCEKVGVPWLYLLSLYSFDPDRTVFVAQSQKTLDEFRHVVKDIDSSAEGSLSEAIASDQINWERIYRSWEAREPMKYWQPPK